MTVWPFRCIVGERPVESNDRRLRQHSLSCAILFCRRYHRHHRNRRRRRHRRCHRTPVDDTGDTGHRRLRYAFARGEQSFDRRKLRANVRFYSFDLSTRFTQDFLRVKRPRGNNTLLPAPASVDEGESIAGAHLARRQHNKLTRVGRAPISRRIYHPATTVRAWRRQRRGRINMTSVFV